MNKNLTCVVAISNEKSFRKFHKAWSNELEGQKLIIIENNAGKTFQIKDEDITHLSWVDIDSDLGKNYWIIPRNSPALISYGCWKATKRGAEIIVILDENSEPGNKPVLKRHAEVLNSHEEENAWTEILKNIKPKGVPFHNRNRKLPIALNHGMWTENAVLDAATELSLNSDSPEISVNETIIPRGHYFSMSSINLAFTSDIAPLMYFLLMGDEYPFEGFGDIWCGVIAKKILDHLNLGCRSGDPFVKNFKEIDIWKSLRSEASTLPVNESLWEKIDSYVFTSDNPAVCYRQIGNMISSWGHPYFQKMGSAMSLWAGMFLGEQIPLETENSDVKSPSQLLSYIKEERPKTMRPKLPSETESLLDFLHTKSQIHRDDVEEPEEPAQTEEKQAKEATQSGEEEIIKVKIIEDEEPYSPKTKKFTTAFPKKDSRDDLKKYTQAFNKEDMKPYVANPKTLMIKKKSGDNSAFIPRKK